MHDDLVYGGRWGGAGGVNLDGVAGEVGEVGCGYLGAAGVVDAEEEDGGFGGHSDCLVGVGGYAGCWKFGVIFMCSSSYLYADWGMMNVTLVILLAGRSESGTRLMYSIVNQLNCKRFNM